MTNMDEDTLTQIQNEERVYYTWERETKNRILAMANTEKKQKLWSKYFPRVEHDDRWMVEAKVF